jgi:hypothetical protein
LHKWFSEGRADACDGSQSVQPTTAEAGENAEKVWQLVHTNQRMTVRMVGEELGMDKWSTGVVSK